MGRTFHLLAFPLEGFVALMLALSAQSQPDRTTEPKKYDAGKMAEVAKSLHECQMACDQCAIHCFKMAADGKKDHLMVAKLCRDCSEFCSAGGRIIAQEGPYTALIARSTAAACEFTAMHLEKHPGDEIMTRCAEQCRRCQKQCRDLIGLEHEKTTAPKTR